MTVRLTVVGDALLDRDVEGHVTRMAPDAPVPVVDHEQTISRPGGAGLAALLAASGRCEVRLITALASDAAGTELSDALAAAGVDVVDLGLDGATPEKIRVRAAGRALVRVDRGGTPPGRVGAATAQARAAVTWADALLVADYGRGVAADAGLRTVLRRAVARDVPLVWDPHPRGLAPVPGATLATPNDGEARRFAPDAARGEGTAAVIARAQALRRAWRARWACVTRGADGAVLAGDGPPRAVPAARAAGADPCGAGDRFASRAAELLACGAAVPDAVAAAVTSASAFVAAGGAAAVGPGRPGAPEGMPGDDDLEGVLARVRARGGTVVATGGCFDLVHAGHVRTLQAARALGDCLVVALNSDASVHRLKGAGRPVVGQDDRAAVLRALGCVDAVAIFEEDTPARMLARVRPDVWVKGGDYAEGDLPEAAELAAWGGRVAILPYLAGRSTTRLIEEVLDAG